MIVNANGVNVDTKHTDEEIRNISISSPIPSYLALVGNVNEDMVSSALGKNNEDNVKGIGKALSMLGWYNGVTDSFPTLQLCDTLDEIYNDSVAMEEIMYCNPVCIFLLKNAYAKEKLHFTQIAKVTRSCSGSYSSATTNVEITQDMIDNGRIFMNAYLDVVYAKSSYNADIKLNGVEVRKISGKKETVDEIVPIVLSDYGITSPGTYVLLAGATGDKGNAATHSNTATATMYIY